MGSHLSGSHYDISAIDYLVAATAEINGADLLTRHVGYYPMFPELKSAFQRWTSDVSTVSCSPRNLDVCLRRAQSH